ncbi:MAG: TIGR02452 family protein [Sphingomonas sp.]
MNRAARVAISQETLQIIEAGAYRNRAGDLVSIQAAASEAIANTRLFKPEDFPSHIDPIRHDVTTVFELTDETTLAAASRISGDEDDVFVLNFASAKNPGGGFLSGSQAQEESLARSSSLYSCLNAKFEMYDFNRANDSCLYSDWMIYSPKVPIFRADDGALLDAPYMASFVSSPAVNAGAVRRNEPDRVGLIDNVNRERARKILWIASQHRHRTLILGAWGCGVFQNDPRAIAGMFHDLLTGEYADSFGRVIMAVYDRTPDRDVYGAFAEFFPA